MIHSYSCAWQPDKIEGNTLNFGLDLILKFQFCPECGYHVKKKKSALLGMKIGFGELRQVARV